MTPAGAPVPAGGTLAAVSASERETVAAGEALGRRLRPGDVVAVDGPLGAGKTRFVRGICIALGAAGGVSSPTFTLLHEYRAGALTIFHFDFYRIDSAADLPDIGFADCLSRADAVCVIEWADRVEQFLPRRRYAVRLGHGEAPGERTIEIREPG